MFVIVRIKAFVVHCNSGSIVTQAWDVDNYIVMCEWWLPPHALIVEKN